MTTALQTLALLGLAIVGPLVVRERDPRKQVISLTLFGMLLGVAFLLYAAPDVALAQFAVGAVALPILVLLTLARMRRHEDRLQRRHGKAGDA